MTRLITSWAWGSRAMARSPCLEHVVASAAFEVARALREGAGVQQALVGEQPFEGVQPAFVVARGFALALGVRDLGDELGLKRAPLEGCFVAHGHGHAEDAALPGLVEDELPVFSRQRRPAGHVGDFAARAWVTRPF